MTTYLYISVAFSILVAAAFGVSRLWRWVNEQLSIIYILLEDVQLVIHERVESLEKTAKADLNSLKAHVTQVVQAAHTDVQRVEQLVKDITGHKG